MAEGSAKKPVKMDIKHLTYSGAYDFYVCQVGNAVTVMGVIIGSGQGGYLPSLRLPTAVSGNALFRARCVSGTGAGNVLDIRQGSDGHGIYREASMANGSRWEFSFSYITSEGI